MSIESDKDLYALKRIGRVVALALSEMRQQIQPGMTTAELDDIGRAVLTRHGARSAPQLVYGFPAATCISLNDEAAHGIPGNRIIRAGDLVNIDVSAELAGYFADAALTIVVPPASTLKRSLCHCAQRAHRQAIAAAQAGRPINVIGQAAERAARKGGFNVIFELTGHGVGRNIHEEPSVPSFYAPWAKQRLTEGLVITVEPFLSTGAKRVLTDPNGWTLKTPDGSLSAQYEHTIVVTRGQPIIVTAL
jgi:methionyl aminopeptidase